MANILNHKLQAHSREPRVCEENKLELEEKNNFLLKYFTVKGSNLEGCRTAKIQIQAIFTTWIVYAIKGIVPH